MLTFPDADASSCDGLEKTNTVACNELWMLLQHNAVKKGFRHYPKDQVRQFPA